MERQKKPLAQILLEFAGQPTASNAARNYKVFMEHWDEIQAEHGKGWSYLMIWKALRTEGTFGFSYPAFTSYIRKVKSRQEKAATARQHQPGIGRAEIGHENAAPHTRQAREPRRF